MSKLYLVLLSTQYDRDSVRDVFNGHPEVSDWFYNLPYSIFVRTTMSARQLSSVLTSRFGRNRHFVTQVSEDRDGLLPKGHWRHFKED